MKGYVAKVGRRKEKWGWVPLTAEKSAGSRHKQRLLGSSSWYKGNKKMQSKNTKTTKAPNGGAPQGPLDRRMVKEPFCVWSSPPWGSWSPWLQTEGGGEDEEEHSELIPSSRLLERNAVWTW